MTIRNASTGALRRTRVHATLALLGALCAVFALGCAEQPQQEAKDAYRPPVYRTGSNVPAGRESDSPETAPNDAAAIPNSLVPKGMPRPGAGG